MSIAKVFAVQVHVARGRFGLMSRGLAAGRFLIAGRGGGLPIGAGSDAGVGFPGAGQYVVSALSFCLGAMKGDDAWGCFSFWGVDVTFLDEGEARVMLDQSRGREATAAGLVLSLVSVLAGLGSLTIRDTLGRTICR